VINTTQEGVVAILCYIASKRVNMDKSKLLNTILRFLDNKPFIEEVIYETSNQYKCGAYVVFTENDYKVIDGDGLKNGLYRILYGDKFIPPYNPNALSVTLPYWDMDYQEFYDIIEELMKNIIDELDRQKYFTKETSHTPQWILDIEKHGLTF
jgi:hypothetical protein